MPLELARVAEELASLNGEFGEGEHGLLRLALDRQLSSEELQQLHDGLDGRAFLIVKPLQQQPDGTVPIHFQAGMLDLSLVPPVLGDLRVGLFGWDITSTLRQFTWGVLGLGLVVLGVGVAAMSRRVPGYVVGGLSALGGGYLIYTAVRAPAARPRDVLALALPTLAVGGH